MVTAAQRIRLGIFLAVASGLLLLTLGMVAGSKLLERRDSYTVRYSDVSVGGLNIGSDVKYSGIRVGRVEDIRIDPRDVATVIVDISVRKGTPIKVDSDATIATMGITGMKTVEIRGGTQGSALLPPGGEIRPGVSDMEAISGKAEVLAEKLEQVLNNLVLLTGEKNRDQFLGALGSATTLMTSLDSLLVRNRASLETSIGNFSDLTGELAVTSRSAGKAVATIDSLLASPSFRRMVANLEGVSQDLSDADLASVAVEMSEAARQANLTFTRVDLTLVRSREDILQSLESLREGMEYFNEFARLISENPSLILRGKTQEEIEP